MSLGALRADTPAASTASKTPQLNNFGNVLDPKVQYANLSELVSNLSGKKITWNPNTLPSTAVMEILGTYFSDRAEHSNLSELFVFRLLRTFSNNQEKAMNSSMALNQTESRALIALAQQVAQSHKAWAIPQLPDSIGNALEIKLADIQVFKRYFENLFCYIFYTDSSGSTEQTRERLEKKSQIIHKIKEQLVTHIKREQVMEKESKKTKKFYVPSTLLRIFVQIAEDRQDDPISGFIRTALRECNYTLANDHIWSKQWDYFACSITDETIPDKDVSFGAWHWYLGRMHLTNDPGKQITFGGNSFYAGNINLPRSGSAKTYFWDIVNAPITFAENAAHFAILQGGHGLKIMPEAPSADYRGVPTKPSGAFYGAKLENAAHGHDTEVRWWLCRATLIDSCIWAKFLPPGDKQRSPAIAARFLWNSGRNSFWKTPVKQVIAEDGALKGSVLEQWVNGGSASENAYEWAVICYLDSDQWDSPLPTSFSGKSAKDAIAVWPVLRGAKFDGNGNTASAENIMLLCWAGANGTFAFGAGRGGLLVDVTDIKALEDPFPFAVRMYLNPKKYYFGKDEVTRAFINDLYHSKLTALDNRLKTAVSKFADDHSILQYEILRWVGALGLDKARIDWRRHLSGIPEVPENTQSRDYVATFMRGIGDVLEKCEKLVHEEIPRQEFTVSLEEAETVPAQLEDDNDPFFSSGIDNHAQKEKKLIEERNKQYYTNVLKLFASSSVVPDRAYLEKELRKLWTTKAESIITGIQWTKMSLNPDKTKSDRIANAISDIIQRTIRAIDNENTSLTRSLDAHISLIATLIQARKHLEVNHY